MLSDPVFDFQAHDVEAQPRPGACPTWGPQDCTCFFADDVVLAASLVENLQYALERFTAECGVAETNVVWFSATLGQHVC